MRQITCAGSGFKKSSRFLVTVAIGLTFMFSQSCDTLGTRRGDEDEIRHFFKTHHIDYLKKPVFAEGITFDLLNGKRESLSDSRGKIVLLNFWSVWCYPCKVEMPDMEELTHKMKSSPFRIIAVNMGDSKEKINLFLKKYPYSFNIALDEKRELGKRFNVTGLPTTFIIDQKGKLLGKVMGPLKWGDHEFSTFFQNISHFGER